MDVNIKQDPLSAIAVTPFLESVVSENGKMADIGESNPSVDVNGCNATKFSQRDAERRKRKNDCALDYDDDHGMHRWTERDKATDGDSGCVRNVVDVCARGVACVSSASEDCSVSPPKKCDIGLCLKELPILRSTSLDGTESPTLSIVNGTMPNPRMC